MAGYDDEGERPSWRDIDRKKDRSRHYGRQEEKGPREGLASDKDRWESARVREALDRLFKGDKGTIEHDRLYNKLHESYGTARFLPTVKRYIERYGLPDDPSTLLLMIDTKDEGMILATLVRLKEVSGGLTTKQRAAIKARLSILKLTERSKEIKEQAGELLAYLENPL